MQTAQQAHNPTVLAYLAQLSPEDAADAAAILAERGYGPATALPEDEDESPFPDEATERGFHIVLREGWRGYNQHLADAISEAASVPTAMGVDCARWIYRLGGGRVWERKLPEWADDLAVSEDRMRAIIEICVAVLKLARQRVGRCNVKTYSRNEDTAQRLIYGWLAACGTDFKGIAGRFQQNATTVKQRRAAHEMFHSSGNSGEQLWQNAGTRKQGEKNLKTPPPPPQQPPVDNSPAAGGGKPETEPAQTDPDEWERAADEMARAAGRMNLGGIEDIRGWAERLKPTLAEALAAIQVVQATDTPVSDASYFKGVITGKRKRGEVPGAVQQSGMARNEFLERHWPEVAKTPPAPPEAPGARSLLEDLKRRFPGYQAAKAGGGS